MKKIAENEAHAMKEALYRIRSVIIGHAVGDALGVPVEFASRAELDEAPITDMEGFGTYPYPKGCWSDDTSMTLAALDSLKKGEIDLDEIMDNFRKWLEQGEYTPTGECFDVGTTCLRAVANYFVKGESADTCGMRDVDSNGNGALMRIHPFVLFTEYCDSEKRLDVINNASALTHAHERSKLACKIYAEILWALLRSPCKQAVLCTLREAERKYGEDPEISYFKRIFDKDFSLLERCDIRSSGYVVDTLEAALWCFLTTDNYRECVLKAVNLGDDTDTVGAVAGGLAGAMYGYDNIPTEWRNTLVRREYIEEMCESACQTWQAGRYAH